MEYPMSAKPMPEFSNHLTGSASDFRAAARRAEQDRAQSRQQELDSQISVDNAPDERIRIWERLHALRLPSAADHPLIVVIAAQTQLTVRAVKDEQQRRRTMSEPGMKAHGIP
jgi:hypothetical protein